MMVVWKVEMSVGLMVESRVVSKGYYWAAMKDMRSVRYSVKRKVDMMVDW